MVPDSFGNQYAVDRALLLGGQALAQAWAASEHSGMPFFWSEDMDHGDKLELLIGAILGCSRFVSPSRRPTAWVHRPRRDGDRHRGQDHRPRK